MNGGQVGISRETAKQYGWGAGCDGWHLLEGAGLSVIEERMPPGTSERRHMHEVAQQFFYVLAGELRMEVEGVVEVLGVGMGVAVGPGVGHQAINASKEDVRFLVVSAPPSHGDRVEL